MFPFKIFSGVRQATVYRQGLKHCLTTPLYANALYLMVSTITTALFGFVFWVVVARFYTEGEVGFGSAIISMISLLAVLSFVGLDASLVRFLPQAENPRQLINASFTLSTVISLIMAGIFVAGVDFWAPALSFIKGNVVFAVVFVLTAPLFTLLVFTNATYLANRRTGFVVLTHTISNVLKIPFAILLVLFFHSFGIVASWGMAMGIAVAVSLFRFLPRVQPNYQLAPTLNLDQIRSMWSYSASNYLFSIIASSIPMALPIIVVNLLGPEQNAYFYVVWMMAGLLSSIPVSMSQSLFAEGSHFEDKLTENTLKSIKFTFMLLVPAVVLLWLAGKWLLLAFGPSYLENGLPLLRILSIASLPLAIVHIYTSTLRVTKRSGELMAIWGFIALAVFLVNYLVMPSWGIIGIGYVWLATQTAVAVYAILALWLRLFHHRS